MNIHYYKVLGPKSRAVVQDIDKASGEAFIARKELIEEYHANGLFMGGRDADTPSGLAFKEEQDAKFLVYKGFSGEFHKYTPKKTCKEGKELAEKLNDPKLRFSISRFILDTLGVNVTISAGKKKKKYHSAAGVIKDQILVTIPGDPDMEGFPHIPFYMKEISESEFMSIASPNTEEKGE